MENGTGDADATRLAEAVEKLAREVVTLRRDVRALGSRFTGSDWAPDAGSAPTVRNVEQALAAIAEARQDIRSVERDLASRRSQVDGIAKDAPSREEMKRWLKT